MPDLLQHCFECRQCSRSRQCFFIFVDHCDSDVDTQDCPHACDSLKDPKWKHVYSIPYIEGE